MSRQAISRPDSGNGGYRNAVRYNRDENERPSVAVATALARYRGEDVVEASTRLYDYVDPEALDSIFADRYDGQARASGTIRFTVGDAQVVVRSERVRVYPDA